MNKPAVTLHSRAPQAVILLMMKKYERHSRAWIVFHDVQKDLGWVFFVFIVLPLPVDVFFKVVEFFWILQLGQGNDGLDAYSGFLVFYSVQEGGL